MPIPKEKGPTALSKFPSLSFLPLFIYRRGSKELTCPFFS